MGLRAKRRGLVGIAAAVPLATAMTWSAIAAPPEQSSAGGNPPEHSQAGGRNAPDVESRVKPIIKDGQREFRDLNENRQIDPYEDWRLSVDKRVDDLIGRMTLEEKAGLMLIDTLNAQCDVESGTRGTLDENADDYVNNQHMHRFIFRNTVTSEDKAVCGAPSGGFGASTSLTPAEAATYMNSMQELSEATRLGIPILYKSNARN
ncbi:MAG TPA: hypothetical protein VFQ15_04735, partial [Jiangellaceae bacterium]|nr:hypothetical protein [Jiangellaceae bacterium]